MKNPADPHNRCQRTGHFGQCVEVRVEGTEFCSLHGGLAAARKAQKRMYELAQAEYKGIYGAMAERSDLLSLREEVALCRMMLQRLANAMNSDADFAAKNLTLNTWMLTLKGLVSECLKVEKQSGATVERAALLQFGAEVIQICADEIGPLPGSQDVLERIASRIIESVGDVGASSPDESA